VLFTGIRTMAQGESVLEYFGANGYRLVMDIPTIDVIMLIIAAYKHVSLICRPSHHSISQMLGCAGYEASIYRVFH